MQPCVMYYKTFVAFCSTLKRFVTVLVLGVHYKRSSLTEIVLRVNFILDLVYAVHAVRLLTTIKFLILYVT